MSNVGSIFTAFTAAIGHAPAATSTPAGSATPVVAQNQDTPAVAGSSVKDWVDIFQSLPSAKSGEVRNQYLGSLQVPTTELDLYVDDDD